MRNGTFGKDGVMYINSRLISKAGVEMPAFDDMRFACYTNKERNAVTSHMFLQHLSKTHTPNQMIVTPHIQIILV